jgi:hypothetical protein
MPRTVRGHQRPRGLAPWRAQTGCMHVIGLTFAAHRPMLVWCRYPASTKKLNPDVARNESATETTRYVFPHLRQ